MEERGVTKNLKRVPDRPLDGGSFQLPSPLEELRDEVLKSCKVRLYLKRDDRIHPELPGNKWRKLERNLQAARDLGFQSILTFGGAYSNHIRATAAAGAFFWVSTGGVVPGGERPARNARVAHTVGPGMAAGSLH